MEAAIIILLFAILFILDLRPLIKQGSKDKDKDNDNDKDKGKNKKEIWLHIITLTAGFIVTFLSAIQIEIPSPNLLMRALLGGS